MKDVKQEPTIITSQEWSALRKKSDERFDARYRARLVKRIALASFAVGLLALLGSHADWTTAADRHAKLHVAIAKEEEAAKAAEWHPALEQATPAESDSAWDEAATLACSNCLDYCVESHFKADKRDITARELSTCIINLCTPLCQDMLDAIEAER